MNIQRCSITPENPLKKARQLFELNAFCLKIFWKNRFNFASLIVKSINRRA